MSFLAVFLFIVWFANPAAAEPIQVFAKKHRVFAVYPKTNAPVWSDDGILYEDILADETTSVPMADDAKADTFCPILVRHWRLYTILGDNRDVLVALDLRREGRLVWRISTESLGGGVFVLPMRVGTENESNENDKKEADIWEDTLTVMLYPTDPAIKPQTLHIDVATGVVLPKNPFRSQGG